MIASLQIQLIGFGIGGVALGHALLFFASQAHSQHRGHLFRKVALQSEDVGGLAPVLLTPNVAIVAGVHQLGADFQVIATLHHVAFEDGANAKRLPYGSGIGVLALVHKGRIPRHYPQMGQLGQPINKAFGDPVAQVLRIRIAPGIDERQNRQ